MVLIQPGFEIDHALAGAASLSVAIPAFGIETAIEMAEPRALIPALGCAPATPPEPVDPAFARDFSGVDDQPWRQVNAPGLGPMLVQRPDESPEFSLHIGCGGRLAFSAQAYPGDGADVFPVSFTVRDEPHPRPAIDFARAGDWWVTTDPALVRALRGAPVFYYSHLAGARLDLASGITDLYRGLSSLCGE